MLRFSSIATLLCSAIGLFSVLDAARAGTPVFVYHPRDVILSFRKIGMNGGTVGENDFEVNLGQASQYYSAVAGAIITNTQFTAAQYLSVFDDFNDLSWSVGGDAQAGDGGDPSIPDQTIWVTAPRTDPNVQSRPWVRKTTSTQALTISNIESIGNDAEEYSGTIPADPINNSLHTITIPVGSGWDADTYLGPSGNYAGYFQGDVESTTPDDFTSGPVVSRSDFYEIRPSFQVLYARYLGYFELRPDGTSIFAAATRPSLMILRKGATNTISFIGISSNLYTLYFTNSSGLSAATTAWPSNANAVMGTGLTTNFQDITSDAARFYRVQMH